MKKFISTAIAFIIVWAVLSLVLCLVSVITNCHEMSDWSYYIVNGLGLTLAGLLGPKISECVIRKFKKS